jgi:hypothetical protein
MEESTPDSSPEETKSLTEENELEIASLRNRPLPWSKWRNFITHFVTATIGIGSLAAVCTFGNTAYWEAHDAISRGTSIDDGFCDIQTASHGSQKLVIDILVFQNLSFSEAKGIDLVWDMLIGQGGRFILAYLLARFVVADSLIWTMERTNIPYHYYTNFSFSTVSFVSISSAVQILFKKRDWRLVLTALWMVFAVGHIMAFPTIWSAATSYAAPSERRYEVPDGTLVPINSSDLTLCFTTQDERVRDMGWEKGHVEIGPSFAIISDQLEYWGNIFEFGGRKVSSEDELRYLPEDFFTIINIFHYNVSANYRALTICKSIQLRTS